MVQDQAFPEEGQEDVDVLPDFNNPLRLGGRQPDVQQPSEAQEQGPQSDLDLTPQDTAFTGEGGEFDYSFIITINDQNYPCTAWETVEAARFVERRYDQGFNGGMGAFLESQAARPNQIYTCVNIDPSTFPYIRMRRGERDETTLTLSNSDTNKPAYGFIEEDSGNREYLYIVNSARSFKIDLGTNGADTPALEATTQPSGFSGGRAGRPVRFEGVWYVPLGSEDANPNARKLTTVGAGDQTNDTWTDVGVKAIHFATMMNEGVAEIWRAHTTNKIDGSADGTTFGADFEVGDSSYAITDMLSVSGELFISKPDRPWRFDSQGNSIPIMEFVNATGDFLTNSQTFDGANSGAHGPYAYWAHSSGLWRIIGDSATPIDPFSQRNWAGITLDSLIPSFNTGWLGFVAWGRWAYAVNESDGVYAGWVENDGTVTWMGNILSDNGTAWSSPMRLGIVPTSANPILWVLDTSLRFAVFDLELDGSIRRIRNNGAVSTDRGGAAETAQIWLPSTDYGEPEKQKQVRLGWLNIDNNAYPNLAISMRVHRDRASTSTQMGSAISDSDGDGHFEFVLTPGSSDTLTEAMLAIRFDTTDTSVAVTDTSIAFVDGGGGADTITDSNDGFGIFAAGERITVSGDSDNNGNYTIVSVVAGTITLATGSLPNAPEGAGDSVTITRIFRADIADLRIRSAGSRAAMPHVYKATIPLDADGLRGFSLGVRDALKKLRDLKSSEGIPVREPAFNSTFTGYILDVQETAKVSEGGRVDYVAEVLIQRWVL